MPITGPVTAVRF